MVRSSVGGTDGEGNGRDPRRASAGDAAEYNSSCDGKFPATVTHTRRKASDGDCAGDQPARRFLLSHVASLSRYTEHRIRRRKNRELSGFCQESTRMRFPHHRETRTVRTEELRGAGKEERAEQ